jgi:phospholipid N-methyltransferase
MATPTTTEIWPSRQLSARDRHGGSDTRLFLREFLRAPLRTGAMTPSSRRLAAAMVEPIPETGDPVVVELGPGTGAFTTAIQSRLHGRGRHLAVELNPLMADRLAARQPAVEIITGDGANLPELLAVRAVTGADVVVSGLPWAAFPARTQQTVLESVVSVLAVGGAFTTFGYGLTRWTAAARHFRRLLGERFEEVVIGRYVTGNLPPAFVYHARRPRPNDPAGYRWSRV